jgi:hypothetical protein
MQMDKYIYYVFCDYHFPEKAKIKNKNIIDVDE